MLEQVIQQQMSQHGTLAAVPNLVSMNMNMNMKNFPVFKIKYMPKNKCKLHKIIQEKTAEKERAALISLSDQQAMMFDDEEEDEEMPEDE